MGNLLDVGPGATSAGTADIAAVLLKAAQRYFYLRGPALRTGKANAPMVRIGIDALLGGESLDMALDQAMIEAHVTGSVFRREPSAMSAVTSSPPLKRCFCESCSQRHNHHRLLSS